MIFAAIFGPAVTVITEFAVNEPEENGISDGGFDLTFQTVSRNPY
jgi:hypothetical protein